MELYYVRHGQTDWNLQGKIQGDTDIPLNDTGKAQAKDAASQLKNIDFDYIIASPLMRAYETAEIINEYHKKTIVKEERLRERNFGELEGNSIEITKAIAMWDPILNYQPKHGESVLDVEKRIVTLLDELSVKYKNNTILMVAHGGISIPLQDYILKDKTKKSSIIQNCEVVHFHL
ncbi:MAG: histidine phosphatase family protein [Erysipelotrichaceae bacterium]